MHTPLFESGSWNILMAMVGPELARWCTDGEAEVDPLELPPGLPGGMPQSPRSLGDPPPRSWRSESLRSIRGSRTTTTSPSMLFCELCDGVRLTEEWCPERSRSPYVECRVPAAGEDGRDMAFACCCAELIGELQRVGLWYEELRTDEVTVVGDRRWWFRVLLYDRKL